MKTPRQTKQFGPPASVLHRKPLQTCKVGVKLREGRNVLHMLSPGGESCAACGHVDGPWAPLPLQLFPAKVAPLTSDQTPAALTVSVCRRHRFCVRELLEIIPWLLVIT